MQAERTQRSVAATCRRYPHRLGTFIGLTELTAALDCASVYVDATDEAIDGPAPRTIERPCRAATHIQCAIHKRDAVDLIVACRRNIGCGRCAEAAVDATDEAIAPAAHCVGLPTA
ncbi:hypothetical protein [Sphingobium sp. BS19]|uniref:hypothetical protein n=1 Tax=Sphingobium sp. BS19 TaxID=3018973 RepID=UPI0022EFA146|nr:hypothetical protein [Sphingobium sp. BS19]GLI96289.1 hypothetical protein Sbs19_01070 [Sphingobium sp. BS19]